MNQEEFNALLEQVARAYEIPPQLLEQNICFALKQGQHTPDHAPSSLEEYISYLARTLPEPYKP